jgi:iron complex transport system ATP-binding protein
VSAILETRAVGVVLGGRHALSSASLALEAGSFTAVVGPNGSGKSTLLRALAGLRRPDEGEVLFRGTPMHLMARREVARHLAFLPQDTRSDFAFLVREVVEMGRHPHRGRFQPTRPADRVAVDKAIDLCDLDSLRHRTVDRLSGGERQRVAIARCLATEPDVVLLDEPTAHLDLGHALDVLSLCRGLSAGGRTIVWATHDLDAALRFATTVVVLSSGRVVGIGAPLDVLTTEVCLEVFGVRAEIVTSPAGERAFVFDRVGDRGVRS